MNPLIRLPRGKITRVVRRVIRVEWPESADAALKTALQDIIQQSQSALTHRSTEELVVKLTDQFATRVASFLTSSTIRVTTHGRLRTRPVRLSSRQHEGRWAQLYVRVKRLPARDGVPLVAPVVDWIDLLTPSQAERYGPQSIPVVGFVDDDGEV